MVMVIKEIKNLTHKEFEEISNIYLSTFPLENAKHLDIDLNHILLDNIGMLLEVPKENISDLDEWLRRKSRIQFYSRLGVKVLKGVNYLLPIQIDDNVEEMYLMIKLSKNITRISKKIIVYFIDSVYTDVYDYRKADLLNKTSANLPDVIDIKELRV